MTTVLVVVVVVLIVMMKDFGIFGPESRFSRAVAIGKYTSTLKRLP